MSCSGPLASTSSIRPIMASPPVRRHRVGYPEAVRLPCDTHCVRSCAMEARDDRTHTSAFGVGRREGHDASAFYARFTPPVLSDDEEVNRPDELLAELGGGRLYGNSSTDMHQLPDCSVALVVTSPPYFVGKE